MVAQSPKNHHLEQNVVATEPLQYFCIQVKLQRGQSACDKVLGFAKQFLVQDSRVLSTWAICDESLCART